MTVEIEECIAIPDHLMRPEDFAAMRERFKQRVGIVMKRIGREVDNYTVFDHTLAVEAPSQVFRYNAPRDAVVGVVGGKLCEGVAGKIWLSMGDRMMLADRPVEGAFYFPSCIVVDHPEVITGVRVELVGPWRLPLEQAKSIVWERLEGDVEMPPLPLFTLRMWVACREGWVYL